MLNNVHVKTIFSLTLFVILLSQCSSVLRRAQRAPGSKRAKCLVKNQKTVSFLLQLQSQGVSIDFTSFSFCLIFSVSDKLQNLIFEVSIILKTSNIHNQKSKSEKSINMHIFQNLIKFFLTNTVLKIMCTFIVSDILLFEGSLAVGHAELATGSERVTFLVKNRKTLWLFLELLGKQVSYKLRWF